MPDSRPDGHAPLSALLIRGLGLFVLWSVLIGIAPADAVLGVIVAAVAARLSLYLLPVGALALRPLRLLAMLPHFLWQSVVAGVDVARRAFAPRMPLRPGFITYRTRIARGARRNAFTSYTSLLPGTVPCGDDGADADGIVYHCLDVGQPIVQDLTREEQRITALFVTPSAQAGEHRDA